MPFTKRSRLDDKPPVPNDYIRFVTGDIRIGDVRKHGEDINIAFGSDLDLVSNRNFVFSQAQIRDILTLHKGAKILEAIAEHGPDLWVLGFTKDDLFKLMGYRNPIEVIETLAVNGIELIRLLGYKKTELLNIIFYGGGSQALPAICRYHTTLVTAGFQREQILRVAYQFGSAYKFADMVSAYQKLKKLNIPELSEKIFKIAVGKNKRAMQLPAFVRLEEASFAARIKKEAPVAPVYHASSAAP